jgi:hypothetical protein
LSEEGALELQVQVTKIKPDGEKEVIIPWRRSESFLEQFLQYVAGLLRYVDNYQVRDYNNGLRNINLQSTNNDCFLAEAPVGNSTYGILIGTSNTAVVSTQYSLQSRCAEGSGTDEVNYGSMEIFPPVLNGSYWDIVLWRAISNTSGSSISVEEVGIQVRGEDSTNTYSFCIIRDLLSFTLNNGETCIIEYRVRI